ncbi:anthranilate synthase component I family protein [Spongiibacter taiwanensis]|uniref:anthranilate synthase component I family protein n=1 Tax=Spongiibacter taiwanensis TaxID=1748242 RepID=UPI0020359595|nr:anthranilate synthase component I family protein [Spongiibacter taiwanensis]USA43472.1 anthranilate synthase component I family protein [Spongiibacter taiwanensis]
MSLPRRQPLIYQEDSCSLFASLHQLEGAVFLDSARPFCQRGRYDIMSAQPLQHYRLSSGTPAEIAEQATQLLSAIDDAVNGMQRHPELPFCGGAIGYLSYDFGEALRINRPLPETGALPALYIGVYDWAIVVDHELRRCELITQPSVKEARLAQILTLVQQPPEPETSFALSDTMADPYDRAHYDRAFDACQQYIFAGDCYQINLSRAFVGSISGAGQNPWSAYQRLRREAAAPFSVYLNMPEGQLLSASPERFLAADQGRIFSQPIKGTAPRGRSPEEDAAFATALAQSEKNRAENVMIVDLIRNDLSKSCLPGSVRTDTLFELQHFETVHHLVSTISGQLKPGLSPLRALLDAFPGGSITGAPKKRAMEIIEELESHRRGLYCGSVFYLGPGGILDSNILIRSFVCAQGQVSGFAGGGIVADSKSDEEFDETWSKIGRLLALFGTRETA